MREAFGLPNRLRQLGERLPASLAGAERAVATSLNYVLILGIVSILVSTLIFGFGGLVEDQHDRVVRSQLEVLSNRIAGDLGQVDTLARNAGSNEVALRVDLPERAVDTTYTVTIAHDGGDRYLLTLRTEDGSVAVTVPFRSTTPIQPTTVHGGMLVFSYDGTDVEVTRG